MKPQLNRNRALVEFAKEKFPNGNAPTLSFLKTYAVLQNNKNTYKFDFNNKEIAAKVGERKLGITDGFVVDKLGFFLASRSASEAGTEMLVTYPSLQIFPSVTNGANLVAGSPANFKNSHLMGVYNAEYKINIGGKDIYEAMDMYRHLHIPEIQDQALPPLTDTEAGFEKIEPYLILRGNVSHYIEVTLPQIAAQLIEAVRQTAGGSPDKEHLLYCYAHGAFVNSGVK